jgi:uncharacterized membrane protein YdbT with pleckstrin-like domain
MPLLDDETVLHELRPRPALATYWVLALGGKFIVVVAVLAIFLTGVVVGNLDVLLDLREGVSPAAVCLSAGGAGLVAAILGLVGSLVYFRALRRTYVYTVTDKRCILCGGLIVRVERSVPYHKVTDVQVSRNIVERLFGIGRLQVFTPGTAGAVAEITFQGLGDPDPPAASINNILRRFRATGE